MAAEGQSWLKPDVEIIQHPYSEPKLYSKYCIYKPGPYDIAGGNMITLIVDLDELFKEHREQLFKACKTKEDKTKAANDFTRDHIYQLRGLKKFFSRSFYKVIML